MKHGVVLKKTTIGNQSDYKASKTSNNSRIKIEQSRIKRRRKCGLDFS